MANFEAHEVPEDFHFFVKNQFVHFLRIIFHRRTYPPEKLIFKWYTVYIILTTNKNAMYRSRLQAYPKHILTATRKDRATT